MRRLDGIYQRAIKTRIRTMCGCGEQLFVLVLEGEDELEACQRLLKMLVRHQEKCGVIPL
jgi:hypothetical protein